MFNNRNEEEKSFFDPDFKADEIFGAPWRQQNPSLPPIRRNPALVTTGSSVVGIRFRGGVMIAADTLVSYFSVARYQNVERIFKINEKTLLGGSGDFGDIQSIKRHIISKEIEDQCFGDNCHMDPESLGNWIRRLLYSRRTTMNPLAVNMIVGGINNNGHPYLGNVDSRGRAVDDYVVTTGFATHLCLPLVRERKPRNRDLTALEALVTLQKCMEVLFYRDTKNISTYMVGVCTPKYCGIQGPYKVNENWQLATEVQGY